MTNLPNHIAVIPDGNRRWAKAKGLLPWIGHEHGARALKQITKEIFLEDNSYARLKIFLPTA